MGEDDPTHDPGETQDPRPSGGESPLMKRAGEIFFAVRELGLADQEDAIRRECAGDASLEELVRLLLKGDDAPLPIEALADEVRAAHDTGQAPSGPHTLPHTGARPGSQIGNYRLLERLGEGGFGVVFMAEQERPVRRRVAIKIIKLGMDTRQVVARFEAERQALALMDHPGIAKVFDAGATAGGRPYFVMELVKGLPINEYCDQHRLTIAQRLALMIQVCDALQHAHQKGVIHRDIKPGNILVSMAGDHALPKIIDFGIAKATSARLTEKTIFTEFRQMIGTPEYMSPEQAEKTGEDVDTRTDVYSAGVLLYELLTGATPFDSKRLRSAAFGEMQRIIREEEPPNPSTRLARTSDQATLTTVAQHRATVAPKLATTIRGELDWIVMKAIEKDRERRYDSAGSFARDLQRFLRGEVVLAAPPDAWYRARKFVRRNKGPVIAATLLALALAAGLAGTSLGFFRAEGQRKRATKEWERAEREKARADEKAAKALAAEREALRQLYSASMIAASDAVANHHPGEARLALDNAPQHLRGWEWRHLNSCLDQTIAYRKGELVPATDPYTGNYDLFPAPDSASYFVLSSMHRKGLSRFDVKTGAETGPVPAPAWDTRDARLFDTPEHDRVVLGNRAFSAADAGPQIAAWDVRTLSPAPVQYQMPVEFLQPGESFGLVTFNRDLSKAFAINTNRMVLLDLPSGAIIASRPGIEATRSTFDPLGRWVMYTDVRGRLTLLDANTLADYALLPEHANLLYSPKADSFSADGARLATAGGDGVVRVWDLTASPRQLLQLQHRQRCGAASMTPDGRHIVTAASDRTVTVWDATDGARLSTYMLSRIIPGTLAVFPDSRTIGAVCEDMSVALWEIGAEQMRILHHDATIYPAMFLPNQGLVVTGGWDGFRNKPGSLRFWDADSGTPVAHALEPGESVVAGAVSRDGALLAVGIAATNAAGSPVIGCGFEVRETTTGKVLWSDRTTGQVPKAAAFDPRGERLAFCLENFLFMYSARTGEQINRIYLKMQLTSLAWSADGTRLALASQDEFDGPRFQRIALVNPADLTIGRTFTTPTPNAVVFSPDSTLLAAGCADGRVRVWNVETGNLEHLLGNDDPQCFAVAFSPDGARLAAAGEDKIIRVWDTATFDLVARLEGHAGFVWSLQWDPSGERLISTSADGTARIWETSALSQRVQAREARLAALATVEPLVARLFTELGPDASQEVVERLNADQSLTPLARRTALQLVLKRVVESE